MRFILFVSRVLFLYRADCIKYGQKPEFPGKKSSDLSLAELGFLEYYSRNRQTTQIKFLVVMVNALNHQATEARR